MEFHVEWFDRLASTNAYLRDCFSQGKELRSGQIVAAREQTAGRGRQDRKWLSAPNQNLCFSLFMHTDAALIQVPSLTMATALAVNDLLRGMGIRSAPKWPNDVLVGDRKICGILSERAERPGLPRAGIIIGIGLNVNLSSEEAKMIDRPATSILIETGKARDLNQTLARLFQPLEHWIGEWESGGFANLRKTWTEQAGPIGKPLAVHDGDLKKNGALAGFGDHGELLLQTTQGIETIWSGDVS
ncbi:MAG: biotin--[acetyl-CoA-carboxylase] ligase [Kiritimatiellales bacterium]|nr:biotin--[acetyl-CoA-carboxylase] ligase [Kiritimatiellales bacterium]MCF7863165.1 biotin--[acetyl-CoA-carboxylase] ligase [Kiritimatiellales bacterium]